MKTSTRCLLCVLAVLTIVLFACGDDDNPIQPTLVKPPAEDLNGSYELLDFREWGYVVSGGEGGGEWGEAGTRTDYSYSPDSYETHSGQMAFTDTLLYQVFVQDGDSVRMPVSIRSITYTDETDQGVIDALHGFPQRSIAFDCTDMELRFDYEKLDSSSPFGIGENTRWEIWRKVSDETELLW